jgi:hypothetical protein
MSGFEQILWYIAIPASVVFAIQTLLTLLGITFDHADVDVQHHDGAGGHAYFPLFTIRNLVVFLMMFGWTGIAMIHQFHTGIPVTVLVALVAGLALMAVVAFMFFGVSKLASSGNVVVDKSIVGSEAKVYLKIPAGRSGFGKVTVIVQGGQKELQATTAGTEIATGAVVKIIELEEDGSVMVAR